MQLLGRHLALQQFVVPIGTCSKHPHHKVAPEAGIRVQSLPEHSVQLRQSFKWYIIVEVTTSSCNRLKCGLKLQHTTENIKLWAPELMGEYLFVN